MLGQVLHIIFQSLSQFPKHEMTSQEQYFYFLCSSKLLNMDHVLIFFFFVLNRAFTATECVESQWAIAGNSVTELSVQELISCSKPKGCSGGNTLLALDWLQKHVGYKIKWTSWQGSLCQHYM